MTLAYELAMRLPDRSDEILETQLERMENEDRKKRMAFVMPALSPDPGTRGQFFERLKDAKNRRPERWALEGLHYLHHPLRAVGSEQFLLPSLELLEEIQSTGDIFFPKRWLVETFSGHRSESAAKVVDDFLRERPDYPFRLKNKILQAADLLLKVGKTKS
jgi:aminopeptidase N